LLDHVAVGTTSLAQAAKKLGLSQKDLVEKLVKHSAKDQARAGAGAVDRLRVEDAIIGHHLIAGRWIIPAAYMLTHIARRIIGAPKDDKAASLCLSHIVFKKPPEVRGSYPIQTRLAAGDRFQFCSGDAILAEGRYAGTDIPAIRLNLKHVDPSPAPLHGFYGRIKPLGYGYGPLLQVVDRVADDGARAIYRLKDRGSPEEPGLINPFLLDGVFQCLLHAAGAEDFMQGHAVLFLPYKIQGLRLYRRMPDTCLAVIDRATLSVGDQEIRGSVRVYSKGGKPVLDLEDMALVKLTSALANPNDHRFSDAAIHAYRPDWRPAAAPPKDGRDLLPIVVGSHRPDLAADLATRHGRVLQVESADVFERTGNDEFRLPFADPEAWPRFLECLPAAALPLFVYAEAFAPGLGSEAAETAMAGLLALCRALIIHSVKARLRIPTLAALPVVAGDPVAGYAAGGIAGFLRTLRLESLIDGTQIDVDQAEALGAAVLAECGPQTDAAIAYRDGGRRALTYRPAPLPDPLPLKPGVYLVAGGAGGIGRKLCLYLAARHEGLHFAWLGRSPFDRDKQEAALAVRALGGRVDYFQADLTDPKETATAIAAIRRLGVVRGVIHSGGSNEEGLIRGKDWASFARVYHAKVRGVELLDRLTADLPLDFFVAFASTIGVTGSVGQCDYSAANALLDSFVHWRNRQPDRPGKAIAIDWTLWHDGGMGLDDGVRLKFLKKTGVIRAALAFPLFERILAGPHAEIVVAGNDRYFSDPPPQPVAEPPAPRLMVAPGQTDVPPAPAASPSPSLAPSSALTERLADIMGGTLADLLSVDAGEIDGDTDLRELGLDSIAISAFSAKVEERWGARIDTTLLYEHPTLREVAATVAAGQRESLARALGIPADEPGPSQGPPSLPPSATLAQRLAAIMGGTLADLLGVDAGEIDGDTDLRALGLDSIAISAFSAKMEENWGARIDTTLLYEYPTLREVAATVAASQRESLARALGIPADQPAPSVAAAPPSPASKPKLSVPRPAAGAVPDIAIVGLTGRYPGHDDVEGYWQALLAGADLIGEIPPDRWDWRRYFGDPKEGEESKTSSKWGGFISDIRRFDAEFFRISPREAELMDPQQRLLLEESWRLLEDAGYAPSAVAGSDTGVFIGISNDDYSNLLNRDHVKKQLYTATGSYLSIAANRISFFLGLKGPSLAIDTACASSLVAICQAVSALRGGECGMAIAGGVNLCITPRRFMAFSHAGMLSPDGRCKTFDASANGYVRGEGVGLVLLKPVQQAIADGDYIYGVIKGSRVNHGGLNTTITAPSAQAQADLIVAAVAQAGLDPAGISWVEAHGTGTPLGDPLEVRGLKKAYAELYQHWGRPGPTAPHIAIGAAKTNIGHLEAASGVAGLTKVLLGMKYGHIPKNLHFHQQNPAIDLAGSPFYFPTEAQPWRPPLDEAGQPQPRRAGVSSFGFGGANAHLVVEAYPNPHSACPASAEPLVFPLSAATGTALRHMAGRLAEHLSEARAGRRGLPPNLYDIAHTLQSGRDALEYRAALCARTLDELIAALRALADGNTGGQPLWTGQVARRRGNAPVSSAPPPATPEELAAHWAGGGETPWPAPQVLGRRTPLPGYPFEGEAYWLPEAPAAVGHRASLAGRPAPGTAAHPLLGERRADDGGRITFHARLSGGEFFLAEHRVDGRPILPGAAFLEMARAAGGRLGLEAIALEKVHWAAPVAGNPGVELAVRLSPEGGRWLCETLSTEGRLHAQCRVAGMTPEPTAWLDAEAGRARCPTDLDVADFYARLESLGLQIRGGAFQVIRELKLGADEVWARLELDPAHDRESLRLHPALLDGAFQTCYALFLAAGDARLQVPFAVERVAVAAPLPRRCQVQARRTRTGTQGVTHFDLRLADEAGRILAAVADFVARPYVVRQPAPRSQRLAGIESPDSLGFPLWHACQPQTLEIDPALPILLFDAGEAFRQALLERHRRAVIHIKPGAGFRRCESDVYELAPDHPDDYRRLLTELADTHPALGGVLYLWGGGEARPVDGVFRPLFLLTQALAQSQPRFNAKLRVVLPYRNDASEDAAARAAVAGFSRAYAKERPSPLFTLVATPAAPEAATALRALAWDCASGSRFKVTEDALLSLEYSAAEPPVTAAGTPLRQGGSYLITGGRGALGQALAAYLCERHGAKVMLSGQSAATPETEALLARLNGLGGTARYVPADLEQTTAVDALVVACMEAFGELHGVFHLAGHHHDRALADKPLAEALRVLEPKVAGTLNLDRATAHLPLDFFCLFSSQAALLGIAGQTDYAYANGFLDGYAETREAMRAQGLRQGRTLAIHWPHWREGGMRLEAQTEAWFRDVHGLRPLETEEGLSILAEALAKGWRQVAVSPKAAPEAAPVAAGEAPERAQLADEIGGMVKRLLKIKRFDPGKHLEDYGADSISLTELTNGINRRYGLKLTPVIFFEYPTVAALLDYLAKQFEKQPSRAVGCGDAGTASIANDAVRTSPHPMAFSHRERAQESAPAVAVVGMAGIMPGSPDLERFWENLANGLDLVTEVPKERWDWRAYEGDPATDPNRTHCRWGGFMPGIDRFDHEFFGLTKREAMSMDPQQRLLLALTWHAIEDAGHKPSDLAGTATGVYMGVSTFDYYDLVKNHQLDIEAHTATGVVHSILANRISWFFDLRGPSFPIDTACSSSLLAIHQAMEAIAAGSCRAALVGGVNLLLSPTIHISFGKAGMLSPDGRCKTFDASADGYVRSEGAAVLYLKPLADALADGDPIHAVLRGSATNHGGRAKSLTAPNPNAQADLVVLAQRRAGIDPATLTYVEAHGTGTGLGDPIEVQGLKKAFARRFEELGKQPDGAAWCGIGSVKTNIGHLEAGAGLAGLCKILLAMRHGELPPTLHQHQQNPYLDLAGSPFYLVKQRTPWQRLKDGAGRELPRRAAISSFGFGGANAHIVLEEHLTPQTAPRPASGPCLLVLSARDDGRLREQARHLAAHLAEIQPDAEALADIAYTLQVGREAMTARLAVRVADAAEAVARLADFAEHGMTGPDGWHAQAGEDAPEPVIGNLASVAAAFVRGAAIDWRRLHAEPRRRVRLPGYPFAPTRCWLPLPEDHPPEGGVPKPRFGLAENTVGRAGTHARQDLPGTGNVGQENTCPTYDFLPGAANVGQENTRPTYGHDAGQDAVAEFQRGFERLEALAATGLIRELAGLGVLRDGQARYDWAAAKPTRLAPPLARLFESLPYALVQRGLAEYQQGILNLTQPGLVAAALARDWRAESRALIQNHPELAAHGRLLSRCLEHFAAVLRGEVSATEVLFPEADDGLVRGIYRNNPHADYLNRLAARRLAEGGAGGAFHILEVGAGTGGATAAALAALAGRAGVEYTYTDVSRHFLEAGRSQFEGRGGLLHFAVLDLERDPLAQGFGPARFDAILAANVLHATRRVGDTLRRLAVLLKPGGRIVINELTRPPVFVTLSFGLLDGWWRYDPEETRCPGSPLLDPAHWRKALEDAGFEGVRIHGDEAAGALAQHIIEARRARAVLPPLTPTLSQREREKTGSPLPLGEGLGVRAALLDHLNAVLVEELRTALRDAGPIPLDKAFVDLGIDSIFGVGLMGRLNQRLGLALKPNLLFDHPTPRRFAAHLAEAYAEVLRPLVADAADSVDRVHDPQHEPTRDAERPAPRSHAERGNDGFFAGACLGIRVEAPSLPAQLRPVPIRVPQPGPGVLSIRVHAFSLNYGDLLCVKGVYPTMPPYPFTPGMEVAGEVAAVGAGVNGFAPGDRVVALTGAHFGGHASMALADADAAVHLPLEMPYAEAVAFPVGYLVMSRALDLADVGPGERVLIQSAAGGVGVIGVQLARERGAEVFVTAGADAKLDVLAGLGAHHGINYQREDFAARVRELTGGAGVDVVINNLGGEAMQKGLDLLAPGGRYVETAMMALRSAQALDLSRLVDNQAYFSFDLRRFLAGNPLKAQRAMADMARTLAEGRIKPVVAKVFPFEQIDRAYAWVEARRNIGRVVVAVPQSPVPAVPHDEGGNHGATASRDIAVIGLAGRYPGASDVDAFWRLLAEGRDGVTEIPADRWPIAAYYSPKLREPGRTYCRHGGFLDGIDRFDAAFFNLSGAEASRTDPQQRLFLETAWEALEQAGYAQARQARCGVFVGVGAGDYQHRFLAKDLPPTAHVFSGNQASILAARIAYHLDLRGPALAVDTACSASLVAIHLACESLRSGESDMAIAGGVFVAVTPQFHILCSQMGMLSPEGRCAAFDAGADGFVPGEGVGAVVLKPLDRALADGDFIWGVIRGSGTNQDGATNGITAPSGKSQTELERQVYRRFGIDTGGIGYIETHGTGTPLGDPVEIEALRETFRDRAPGQKIALGSVKTNIGHAATAAGIAGVSKTLLALHHRQLPPSLHFQAANPLIAFEDSPFHVNTRLQDWPAPETGPRLAAVSAFGFSGTNGHLVLAEAPPQPSLPQTAPFPILVCCSGPRMEDARRVVARLAEYLAAPSEGLRFVDLAYTLNVRRPHHAYRILFPAADLAELRARLAAYLEGQTDDGVLEGQVGTVSGRDDALLDRLLARAGRGGQQRAEALRELGRLFTQGVPIPWEALFVGSGARCVPLPTYPFERRRYWVDETPAANPVPDVGCGEVRTASIANDAVPGVTAFHRLPQTLHPDWPYIHDHGVDGRALLPGVAYLEFAAARWREAHGTPATGFRDIAFLRPLVVAGEAVPFRVALDADGGFRFNAGESGTEHARGQIVAHPAPMPPNLPPLAQAVAGLEPESAEDFYARLERQGYRYGPSLRAVQALYRSGTRAVAHLRLPAAADPLTHFEFHPSLLDGALQAVAGSQDGERPLLPYLVERVDRHAPLEAEMVAHVQALESGRYRLDLTRLSGEVLLSLDGICARALPDPLEKLCYRPGLRALPPVGTVAAAPDGGVWIVHSLDGPPLHRSLAALHAGQPVRLLGFGAETRNLGPDAWEIGTDDPAAFEQVVEAWPAPARVYFLALPPAGTDLAGHERRGVFALLRLVQAFQRRHPGQALVCKVVTADAVAEFDGGVAPWSAGLHGFCRSAARELPEWRFACIDVDLGDSRRRSVAGGIPTPERGNDQNELALLAAAIAAEPVEVSGGLVALRDGQRYRPDLVPARLPIRPARNPYRQGGTYVILGGAGGIGLVLARHLIQAAGARVALIGRRPPAAGPEAAVAGLCGLGGDAFYIQADASDPAAMATAIAQIKARFGPIHGAVHSAMVLADRAIERMDEATFAAALHPKGRATVHFCQALADEPLDFLLLFSSLQSFVGGPGQSNYAAGCAFLDAFAAYWRGRVNYPVRLLHWGYWGSVGVVASESYRRRMADMGLHSIEPDTGMAALDRFLASAWPRLLVARAERHFLEEIGVRFEAVWHELSGTAPVLPADVQPYRDSPPDGELTTALHDFAALETWCERWTPALLVRLGLAPARTDWPGVAALAAQWGVLPKFLPLLRVLFQSLERTGHAEPAAEGYRLTGLPFPRWDALVAEGRAIRAPAIAAFVDLVQACADDFDAVLQGRCAANEVLFPQGSGQRVRGIYREHPIADFYNRLAGQWARDLAGSRAEPLRILEVGGGTGGTTLALLDALAGRETAYCFTDISPGLVARAKRMLPVQEWRVFDLEQDPLEQGLPPGGFDLIVAGNAVHAAAEIGPALARLKILLRPGGWLLLNELTAEYRFATLSFGLTDAWWGFKDGWRRLPHAPLLAPAQWLAALRENGFRHAGHFGLEGHQGQRLIVAQSDGHVWLEPGQALNLRPAPSSEKATVGCAEERSASLANDVASAPPHLTALPGGIDALCATVADIMGQVLEIDAADLDWDAPHQRYGVDSILAVAIIERINAALEVRLRSTDFFNFATVRELADHILALRPAPPPEPDTAPGSADAALLDLFQRVAAGEIDLDAANRLILEQGFE
jgi:acyl transferase domain-containing protein/NADPH:quinone reductase-like Zn-dependent oxidoreductase/acyl carrier protein/SAM-dependent methyltransferase